MRLRIKRRIRTADSEQWTLFDADSLDEGGLPQNIGKLDLHYDTDMTYATLLLWSEFTSQLQDATVKSIIDDLLEDVTEPIGVPADYSLDFFTPSVADYKFFTNYEDEEDFEEEDDEDDDDEGDDVVERNGNTKWR